jgi:hypothetical protein
MFVKGIRDIRDTKDIRDENNKSQKSYPKSSVINTSRIYTHHT